MRNGAGLGRLIKEYLKRGIFSPLTNKLKVYSRSLTLNINREMPRISHNTPSGEILRTQLKDKKYRRKRGWGGGLDCLKPNFTRIFFHEKSGFYQVFYIYFQGFN